MGPFGIISYLNLIFGQNMWHRTVLRCLLTALMVNLVKGQVVVLTLQRVCLVLRPRAK